MRHNDIIKNPSLSPQDAVRLGKLRTISDIIIVQDIYEAYDTSNCETRYRDPYWFTVSLLATCFNAGRIEGVRMERKRRNKSLKGK